MSKEGVFIGEILHGMCVFHKNQEDSLLIFFLKKTKEVSVLADKKCRGLLSANRAGTFWEEISLDFYLYLSRLKNRRRK